MSKGKAKSERHPGYGGVPGTPSGKHRYVLGEKSSTHATKELRRANKVHHHKHPHGGGGMGA